MLERDTAMKILLAIDGSPCSDAAVAEVSRRPWPPGSEVRLVTVDTPADPNLLRSGTPSVFDDIVAQQRAEAAKHLNAAAAILRQNASDLSVTPILLEGHPAEIILAEAERWGADLIVVGSHGYGAFRRFFLGSTSTSIATNAHCSVEIVRGSEQNPPDEPAAKV